MKKTIYSMAVSSLLVLSAQAGEIHEWGTFTTVSGSDGTLLSGLHVEEEVLPSFVYSHAGMTYNPSAHFRPFDPQQKYTLKGKPSNLLFKGIPSHLISHATVKMETPVIYFYGENRERYNIKVGFNGGTISQWYPQRKTGDVLPPIELDPASAETYGLNFAKPFKGFIEWDVDTIPRSEADEAFTFKPNQSLTWEYPRVPGANMVKVGEEYENYLFYRGVGNFKQPVKFSVNAEETVQVSNLSAENIPFAFAFENSGGVVRYKTFSNGVAAGKQLEIKLSDWKTCKKSHWRVEVFQEIRDGLLAQGLTLDESNGMVKTWWKSYFQHEGLRVFWVVPQGELDKVLPIQITPKPEKLVRVIVGRSDILRPSFEKKLKDSLAIGRFKSWSNDRFYLPFQERLTQLVETPYYLPFSKDALTSGPLQVVSVPAKEGEYNSVRFDEEEAHGHDQTVTGEWEILDSKTLQIGKYKYVYDEKRHVLRSKFSLGTTKRRQEIILPVLLK